MSDPDGARGCGAILMVVGAGSMAGEMGSLDGAATLRHSVSVVPARLVLSFCTICVLRRNQAHVTISK